MLAGTSFAAGLNVYATVATLGLLSRAGLIALPSSLDVLRSWWIIGVALALFGLEFFADKVPAFDLIWNALHTFIRIPIAARCWLMSPARIFRRVCNWPLLSSVV